MSTRVPCSRRLFGRLLLGGLAAAGAGRGRIAHATVRRELDVPYVKGAADGAQRLDLYLPASQPGAQPPLFVYIHGGAWVSGDKAQYAAVGRALAGSGIAVAVINYRLSGDGKPVVVHPAHVRDAAAAVAFVRAGALRYGYDPGRVFVGGHSAGGFISAHLAFDPSHLQSVGEKPDAIRGFLGLEGIYDVPALDARFPSYRRDFLSDAFGPDPAAWKAASPQNLKLTTRRPWLLIHSPEDELVDPDQTVRFAAALRTAGVPVQLLTRIDGSHFSIVTQLLLPVGPVAQATLAFLRS